MRRDLRFLIPFCTTDARDPLSDYTDNGCYADAPPSGKLRLQARRIVRNLFAFSFPSRSVRPMSFREHENLKVSNLVFASNKQTDTTPTMLDRIEVTVHTAFEERSTAQMSDDGSSDTSTNEQASEIAGGTSKLDISQSSTHPLSTVSPSPHLAQSA